MQPWESVPASDNGSGRAAGGSKLAMGGGAWACAIAGMSEPVVSRIGAQMAGIVVRNPSDWRLICVRFYQEARPGSARCAAGAASEVREFFHAS
jgi:hypothetical protein